MKLIKRMAVIMTLALSICVLASCGPSKSSSKSDDSSSMVIEDRQPVTYKDKSIAIENED